MSGVRHRPQRRLAVYTTSPVDPGLVAAIVSFNQRIAAAISMPITILLGRAPK